MKQVENLILVSKYNLLGGNIEKSLSLLDQALEIAQVQNQQGLIEKIKNEQDSVFDELNKWKRLVDIHSSLIERMNDSKVEELMVKLFVSQNTDL